MAKAAPAYARGRSRTSASRLTRLRQLARVIVTDFGEHHLWT